MCKNGITDHTNINYINEGFPGPASILTGNQIKEHKPTYERFKNMLPNFHI